jgi:hypothetical protein
MYWTATKNAYFLGQIEQCGFPRKRLTASGQPALALIGSRSPETAASTIILQNVRATHQCACSSRAMCSLSLCFEMTSRTDRRDLLEDPVSRGPVRGRQVRPASAAIYERAARPADRVERSAAQERARGRPRGEAGAVTRARSGADY